jgi:hypothetical protein
MTNATDIGFQWIEQEIESENLKIRVTNFGDLIQILWRREGDAYASSVELPSDVLIAIVEKWI